MSRVCSETCRPLFLSFTFFFFLFLWSGFSDLYLFFNIVHFFLFFSFSILVFFFFFFAIHISKSKIVEVGLRVNRRLSKSAEKQKAGQMVRHDTRHLDWSFIYIEFLYRSFLKFLTMHWKNCGYFILHLKIYTFRKIHEIQVVKIRNFWRIWFNSFKNFWKKSCESLKFLKFWSTLKVWWKSTCENLILNTHQDFQETYQDFWDPSGLMKTLKTLRNFENSTIQHFHNTSWFPKLIKTFNYSPFPNDHNFYNSYWETLRIF